jgi:hypothetical protein
LGSYGRLLGSADRVKRPGRKFRRWRLTWSGSGFTSPVQRLGMHRRFHNRRRSQVAPLQAGRIVGEGDGDFNAGFPGGPGSRRAYCGPAPGDRASGYKSLIRVTLEGVAIASISVNTCSSNWCGCRTDISVYRIFGPTVLQSRLVRSVQEPRLAP